MFLKDSSVFFSFIKKIFCYEKNPESLDVFSHLITLDKRDIFSFSHEEKEIFFYHLNILICILKCSVIGLKTLVLGGKIQIDKKGITVCRWRESPNEIISYSEVCFTRNDLLKSCYEFLDLFNKKFSRTHTRIYRLVFVLNSFVGLDNEWRPHQNFFCCAKYWNSNTGKWNRLPESRVRRMSIQEAGEIVQGLTYRIFGFHAMVNIRVTYKEVVLTFKDKNNELKVRKMFIEMKKQDHKKDLKIMKEVASELFFLLMSEAKVSELLDFYFSKVIFFKWFIKIRNFCLGRYSMKRNFQIIFSQEKQKND